MINSLLYKYLDGEASEEEVRQVFEWIQESDQNKREFIKLKKVYALSAYEDFQSKNFNLFNQSTEKKGKQVFFSYLKYAAVLVVVLGVALFYYNTNNTPYFDEILAVNSIVLDFGNGEKRTLSDLDTVDLKDNRGISFAKQYGRNIVYDNSYISEDKYHTLEIPNGKVCNVILFDGTKITVNSGSKVVYPTKYSDKVNRQVTLVGEAYFEVTKNDSSPFVVSMSNINIRVLGTRFNASSFDENEFIDCVLVEGEVEMYNSEEPEKMVYLIAGQKSQWRKEQQKFTEPQIVDASNYVAWIDGEMVFNNSEFKSIIEKIERSYNFTIINNNKNLAKQQFTGKISIDKYTPKDILELLKLDTYFEYLEKPNNTIEILE